MQYTINNGGWESSNSLKFTAKTHAYRKTQKNSENILSLTTHMQPQTQKSTENSRDNNRNVFRPQNMINPTASCSSQRCCWDRWVFLFILTSWLYGSLLFVYITADSKQEAAGRFIMFGVISVMVCAICSVVLSNWWRCFLNLLAFFYLQVFVFFGFLACSVFELSRPLYLLAFFHSRGPVGWLYYYFLK